MTATDDAGVASSGERDFALNHTLGFAAAVTPDLAVPRPKARAVAPFKVTRAATVARGSRPLRRRPPHVAEGAGPAGDLQVAWDGRTDGGAVVYSGSYVAEVTARTRSVP